VINNNLDPISHGLGTIHPLQTDDNRAIDVYSIAVARQKLDTIC